MREANELAARSALGFAQRAGRVISGDFAVEKAVKSGQARLVLLDAAASAATQARYAALCERTGIPCLCMEGMDAAIGRYGRRIAAVMEDGFARMILDKTNGGNV